jgi:hypothetical protein
MAANPTSILYVSATEGLLKKWSTKDKDLVPFEKMIVNLGMTLIPKGKYVTDNGSSFLGSGIDVKAYEVLWNGKRAVIKISFSEDAIENANILFEKSKEFPAKYRKHIMKVYESDRVPENFLPDYYKRRHEGGTCYYQVVEFLVPLPNSLKNNIFTSKSDFGFSKERYESVTDKDVEELIKYELVNRHAFELDSLDKRKLQDIVKFINSRIKDEMSNDATDYYNLNPETTKTLKQKFSILLKEYFSDEDSFEKYSFDNRSITTILFPEEY